MKIKSPISEKYGAFLNALLDNTVTPHEDISYQIFYDLFRIREFQWQYKVEFSREVDSSLSDIFQDIIAHYLKILSKYEISLCVRVLPKRTTKTLICDILPRNADRVLRYTV